MNKKMIKGAALTGLGVALLLGGGGTLAVWNDSDRAGAGSVVTGDLQVTAQPGEWTSNIVEGKIDIGGYQVVPNETLTYSQQLDVTTHGDAMKAELSVGGAAIGDLVESGLVTVTTTLDDGAEVVEFTHNEEVQAFTAQTVFAFGDATGREGVNQTVDLSGIHFVLEQVAPSGDDGN